MLASYFWPVTPSPFRPPLLSGLFVSFPGVPVCLFFLVFLFSFFFPLVLLFVFIHLCSLFVFLFNANAFIIYFPIFQFTILSKTKKRKTVSITVRVYIPYFVSLEIMSKTSDEQIIQNRLL